MTAKRNRETRFREQNDLLELRYLLLYYSNFVANNILWLFFVYSAKREACFYSIEVLAVKGVQCTSSFIPAVNRGHCFVSFTVEHTAV